MACLKLMGGYCFLEHKDGKKSLMNSINLTMDDLDYVDEIQMNGLHVDYEYSRHIHYDWMNLP